MHYNHHMLLTLDIGNTAVEAMVFSGSDPRGSLRFPTPESREPSAWDPLILDWPDPGIREVIVSSVVPGIDEPLADRLLRDKGLTPRFVDHGTPLEIEIAVDHPHEVGADRIADVVEAAPEHDVQSVAQPPRLSGEIRLEQVSFQYDQNSPMVLHDINVHILPGQKVAIVGRTGSGSSRRSR